MDFEKLGAFYLGKEFDLTGGQPLDRLVMYDARDLTTHAVCVGMTGSGKTGLCITLLEEAAIDRVPAIVIDPKGDIANLLLTFPALRAEDFRPWINADDARRKGLSEDEFAAQQAQTWRDGLARWGQDGARIRSLRDAADFVVYTPGSDAGLPVSILHSFAAPPLSWDSESELLRERIQGTVSALLGLVGIDADPLRSREHILLANLFEHFWRLGEDLDLAKIILSIQNPPIRQLGVFDVDTFFPQKERFELAMILNNIIAAPSFQTWLQGQPLDVAAFLNAPDGKPRHAIFSIAHLNDAERMFFVTMLLNQVITWMRGQSGTTSLRALLYMDEIFGFFPPVANPPSKQAMLTLLKQARAFGLGVVLTTQNPVDLDYKGLTNTGTWFIGRLQTERDKARLLDGLESASAQAGEQFDRAALERTISSLGQRVFLLHNVHADTPLIFQTRWAMSYLRGPLTRAQIRQLMAGRSADQPPSTPLTGTGLAPAQPAPIAPTPAAAAATPSASTPPSLPAAIPQVYLPARKGAAAAVREIESRAGGSAVSTAVDVQSRTLLYVPAILGLGRVHFVDQQRNVNEQQDFALLTQPPDAAGTLAWERAQPLELEARELLDRPEPEATFDALPDSINEVSEFTALKKELADHLYRSSSITLLYSPPLKAYSLPNESERDFQARLQHTAREQRDQEVDKIEDRYDQRLQTLKDRLRRAEAAQAQKEAEARSRQQETLVSVGESVVGMFLGRRSTRAVSSAMSHQRQVAAARMRAEEKAETVEGLKQEIQGLERELQEEVSGVRERWDRALEKREQVAVTPRRTDIQVDLFALAWAPHWQVTYRDRGGAPRTDLLPAY